MDRILLSLITGSYGSSRYDYHAVEVRELHGRYFARATQTIARENPLDAVPVREVSATRVVELQEAINRVLAQSEKNADLRFAAHYYATLERFIDEKATVVETSSTAPRREDFVRLVENPALNSELKSAWTEMLSGGYHVWAHELHKIARACVGEWGSVDV